MNAKYLPIRVLMIAIGSWAVTGCANFHNSFGQITDFLHTSNYTSDDESTGVARKSDADRGVVGSSDERNLTFAGVKVEMSDGALQD